MTDCLYVNTTVCLALQYVDRLYDGLYSCIAGDTLVQPISDTFG